MKMDAHIIMPYKKLRNIYDNAINHTGLRSVHPTLLCQPPKQDAKNISES